MLGPRLQWAYVCSDGKAKEGLGVGEALWRVGELAGQPSVGAAAAAEAAAETEGERGRHGSVVGVGEGEGTTRRHGDMARGAGSRGGSDGAQQERQVCYAPGQSWVGSRVGEDARMPDPRSARGSDCSRLMRRAVVVSSTGACVAATRATGRLDKRTSGTSGRVVDGTTARLHDWTSRRARAGSEDGRTGAGEGLAAGGRRQEGAGYAEPLPPGSMREGIVGGQRAWVVDWRVRGSCEANQASATLCGWRTADKSREPASSLRASHL